MRNLFDHVELAKTLHLISGLQIAITLVEQTQRGLCVIEPSSSGRERCPSCSEDGHLKLNRLLVLDELAGLQFTHGGLQLGLRVHHDGSIPRHRLFQRLA